MAKAGMRRPEPEQAVGGGKNKKLNAAKNIAGPVPEIQGKAKHGKNNNPNPTV